MYIMCVLFVQRFETRGRRFTNDHFYYFIYSRSSALIYLYLGTNVKRPAMQLAIKAKKSPFEVFKSEHPAEGNI